MNDIKNTFIDHALKLVPFDGWTDYTIRQAAKSANISEHELKKLFPAGANDCVAFFLARENVALAESLTQENLMTLRVPERIEKIILHRLKSWQAKREIVRRTISFNALPWNSVQAYKSLYDTVDLMWRLAGDAATDFSFYSKRMTLAAVYGSTVLFWLSDHSAEHQETELFLKRRLDNVAAFGRIKKQMKCA